jgi:hypothetical protein
MEEHTGQMRSLAGPNGASSRWCDIGLIALLLLVAVVLRGWLVFHTEVLARDSIGYIRYALEFENDTWANVLRNNHQHPCYPLTILGVSVPVRAWTTLSEADAMTVSAQLASSLAAVLLVIPMYFLGKILMHRAAGFGAAALFQCLPVPAHILSDGLSEALFLLLACSTLALGVLALRGSKPRLFAAAGLFCGLSYLTRPEGALVLAATLMVLAGLQLAKAQRRSVRQLVTCGASMTAMAIAVGSPYVIATHRLSNKPSLYQWLGKEVPETKVDNGQRTMEGAGLLTVQRPAATIHRGLMANTLAVTLNLQDTYGHRAVQAVWFLAGELVKCFHYVVWVPVLIGMWWCRQRLWKVPGMWVLVVLCGLIALGLCRLAIQVGYMSDRHLMLLVLCGCYAAAIAVWEMPTRWLAWRRGETWSGTAGEPIVHSQRTAWVAVLLLAALLATGLHKSLEKLHANRAGHHAAGLWLAQNAAPADIIDDDHCWASYYAGRIFQELKGVSSPPGYVPARYVVVGRRDREMNQTWNNPGSQDEAKLRKEGGRIVYYWPAQSNPTEASLVVYAMEGTR